jgi:hypothetical protein
VLDNQLNVKQDVDPIRSEAVKSWEPKLTPDRVTLPPLLAGEFAMVRSVMMGESKVKYAVPVPMTLSTLTLILARPEPDPTWQESDVTVVQPVVSHAFPPNVTIGDLLLTPKLNPVNVTLKLLLVGAFLRVAIAYVATGESNVNEFGKS